MKSISAALATHLAGEVVTLCALWKIMRQDGVTLYFTDHDQDIVFGGHTYRAATGFTRTAVQSTGALAVDNLDVEAVFDDAAITEADMLAGRYDGAEVLVSQVNWQDLSQGALHERRGFLGQVILKRGMFGAELRGLTQALTRHILEVTTPDCRADLYDRRCHVDPAAFTVESTVTTGGSNRYVFDTARGEATGYFEHGAITFLDGANAGLTMEIKAFVAGGSFELWLPTPMVIATGTAYRARAGCDKRLETCIGKFDNVLNFRGEPHIPGQDFVARNYPDVSAPTMPLSGAGAPIPLDQLGGDGGGDV